VGAHDDATCTYVTQCQARSACLYRDTILPVPGRTTYPRLAMPGSNPNMLVGTAWAIMACRGEKRRTQARIADAHSRCARVSAARTIRPRFAAMPQLRVCIAHPPDTCTAPLPGHASRDTAVHTSRSCGLSQPQLLGLCAAWGTSLCQARGPKLVGRGPGLVEEAKQLQDEAQGW